ncbi:MAG TPA: serine hydrolase [Sporichthya sp.]|nr:serine hydrolase [Sporichthya sp.]
MDKRTRLSALATAALTGLGGFAVPSAAAAAPRTPETTSAPTSCAMTRTGEYQKTDAGAVGLDGQQVQKAVDYWVREGAENLKVFRHGCLVSEGALNPLTDRVPRQNWSQTKTVSALIAGIVVRKGLIKVDDPIGKYLPAGLGDAAHRAITIRSVLNMTTGVQMNWTRGLNFFSDISRPREAMTMKTVHKPGEYFEYDQDTPSVLNYVVQHALRKGGVNMDYQAFAQKELFNKLGIPLSAYWWQRDRSGNTLGYSQLFLRPLEFGRIGDLMMHEGVFAGERLIDKSYMKELRTGSKANCGYGFMVWLNSCSGNAHQVNGSIMQRREISPAQPFIASAPADMYYSWGYHGQHTFVIPSLDMIITRSGERPADSSSNLQRLDPDLVTAGAQKAGYFEFFKELMAGVKDMPRAASIKSSGTYTGDTELNADPDTYMNPATAGPGSYLAVGPEAPQGCTFLGCEGESNDGLQTWLSDVPRTFPGVIGREQRPNG